MAKIVESHIDWDLQLGILEKTRGDKRAVISSGSVSFSVFVYDEIILIISPFVEFNREVPHGIRESLIMSAIWDTAKEGQLSKGGFVKNLGKKESEYLSKPKKKFVLTNSISIPIPKKSSTISYNNVSFRFDPKVSLESLRATIEISPNHLEQTKKTKGLCPLLMFVEARDPSSAFELATSSLDVMRGFWNLLSADHRVKRFGTSMRRVPINKILMGPIYTLHESNMKPAMPSYWYEYAYDADSISVMRPEKFKELLKPMRQILKLISKKSIRGDIEVFIVRYCRSLDWVDSDSTFLRLWSLLEGLTDTKPGDSHTETVKKASFIWRESRQTSDMLHHIRERRNKLVHVGISTGEDETPLYQLKEVVEQMILYLVNTSFDFKNMSEVAEFLNKPNEVGGIELWLHALKRKREIGEYAKRFKTPKTE